MNANSVFFFAVVVSSISGRRREPYIPEGETGQVERTKKTWRVFYFLLYFRLIAGAIDRNINIPTFVYVPAQQFKKCFSFEIT